MSESKKLRFCIYLVSLAIYLCFYLVFKELFGDPFTGDTYNLSIFVPVVPILIGILFEITDFNNNR